jgi:hypothetical protein
MMILAPVRHVEPGSILARPVVALTAGRPQRLLETGRRLSPELTSALARAGATWVYIESDLGEGIAPGPLLPGPCEDQCRREIQGVFALARRRRERVSAARVDELVELAAEILVYTRTRGDAPLSHDPTRAGAGQVSHAVGVAIIGLAMGELLVPGTGVPSDAVALHLTRLGAGLLLHDIGTAAIPPDMMNHTGPLNDMQREVVRWHPHAGEEIVADAALSSLVGSVVSQHHEWMDGGGYPDGLAGEDIHLHARIAAVADAYDALSVRSLTAGARPSDMGLRMVGRWTGTAFDPAVTTALEQVVAPFPPGCPVLLSDGTRGIVVENVPGHPQSPVVRLTHGPDGEPLALADVALADADDPATVTQALDHPSAPAGSRAVPDGAAAPPSLAIRGLEAGGLLDARASLPRRPAGAPIVP